MGQIAMQAQMNGIPEGVRTGSALEQAQMNNMPGQGQFEQVSPMQNPSEQMRGWRVQITTKIEQEKIRRQNEW